MIESALAVAVALVCIAAAVVVVRSHFPLVVRVVAVLVFLYGASVAATVGGGGFAAALDGAPFPALPYWMRAAFLDGQAILPLAVLAAIVLAVGALIARKPRRAGVLLLLSIVALGCTQLAAYEAGTRGMPTIVAFEAPAPALLAPGAPCPDPTLNPLAGVEGFAPAAGRTNQMGGSLGGMLGGGGNAAANATPKPTAAPVVTCTTDPNVAAFFAQLDALDPKVPQDTARVPALAASLTTIDAAYAYVRDRIATEPYPGAMRGAFGTMMARGGSSADKALLLAALLGAQQVPVRFATATLSDAEVGALLQAPAPPPDPGDNVAGVLDDRAQATTAKIAGLQRDATDAAVGSSGAIVDDLLARVAAAGTKPGGDFVAVQRAALRSHSWIQVQSGGVWVDLDPALPSAVKGTHLGAQPSLAGALPEEAYATVAFTLYADRAGARAATPAVTVSKHVADVAGTPVTIAVANRDATFKNAGAVKDVIASVTVAGAATASDPLPLADLDAVRLEIAVTQPGRDPRVYRRTLYRRPADPAAVVAAVTVADNVLVTTGDYDGAFVDRREIDNLRAAKPIIVWSTEHRRGTVPPPPVIPGEPFPLEALRYVNADAVTRERIAQSLVPGGRFAYDRPTISLVRRGLRATPQGLRGTIQFDIVEGAMTVVGGDAQRAVRANAIRGAIDASIERHVIGDTHPGGTRALFAAAKAAGDPEVVVAAGPGDPTAAATLDPDARAHLADTLALHQVAIVTQRPVALNGTPRSGWWAFDPADGDLVGRMEDGAGQGEVEYVLARLNDDATLYAMIQFYADFFRCIAMGVEAPLTGNNAAVQSCLASSLCNYLESLTFGFGIDSTFTAFFYNLLDITFYNNTPGLSWKTSSLGGGAVCAKAFPFSFPQSS